MLRIHRLHGRIRHFWMFMAVTSVVAFISNSAVQIIIKGEVDFHGAITTSVIIGIVLAILMVSKKSRKRL